MTKLKITKRCFGFLGVMFFMMLSFSSKLEAQFKPIKIAMEKDSSGKAIRWTRFLVFSQFQMNFPFEESATTGSWEFLARRLRFLTIVKASENDNILFHFGINNQRVAGGGAPSEGSGAGKKPQLYIHDFTYDRRIFHGDFGNVFLGAGLNYWNGGTRFSRGSTLNLIGIDLAFQALPFIETSDQFARQFGVYTKGNFGQLGYNITLDFPFQASTAATTAAENIAAFNDKVAGKLLTGYFFWQFLDKEGDMLPYAVGTYLGGKSVFNIGVGGWAHFDGMHYLKSGVETVTSSWSISADIYADIAIGEKASGGAVSFYGAYYYYNMGPNYYRQVGDAALIATGNSFVGMLAYTTGSYLPGTKLGVFVMFTGVAPENSDVEKGEFWNTIDAGVRWHILGKHNLTLTVAYRNASKKVDAANNIGHTNRSQRIFAQFSVWL